MVKCEYCGEKIGLLEVRYTWIEKGKRAIHDDCLVLVKQKEEENRRKFEAKQRKEQEEIEQKQKEKCQKMSIQELIRELGNPNENEKRMATQELGKREDVKAVNAVWEALNLEGGYDFSNYDWKYYVFLDTIPTIGKLGGNEALEQMIKMRKEAQKIKEAAEEALNKANVAINNYKTNPNPEIAEMLNKLKPQLDWTRDAHQKNQTMLDALDDAIKKLKAKKFEKMADRIEANLDNMSWQEFEDTIFHALNAERYKERVGDMGIDGITKDGTPIQVKQSSNIGRNVVDNFETAIRRFFPENAENKRGIIVAFSFTNGAYEEIIRAKDDHNLNIQLITVDELGVKED